LEVSPSNDVTLTLNGQRRTFYFNALRARYEFGSGWFIPNLLTVYFPAYTAEPGMFGTLSVWNGGSGTDRLELRLCAGLDGEGLQHVLLL